MERSTQKFLPALEGVRGYAFIVVFVVHYLAPPVKPTHMWVFPWFLLTSIGWLAVPIFFAVSGYLITGILYRSKGREGFFKVFYGRRALRVFPLYYLVLASILVAGFILHVRWGYHNALYLFYLQNLSAATTGSSFPLRSYVNIDHFWSLAVEEQFYFFWPLVIWFCRSRESMLRVSYTILAGCFVIRLGWPLFDSLHTIMPSAYVSTFARVDGIIVGAVVALWKEGGELPKILSKSSYWIVTCGVSVLVWRTVVFGHSLPRDSQDYFNIAFMLPVANLISAAVLVLLLFEETWVSRMCCWPTMCNLGRMSYGLYVFHYLYFVFFTKTAARILFPYFGSFWAHVLPGVMAFGLTLVLAMLAQRFIEAPAIRAKDWFRYGGFVDNGRLPQVSHANEIMGHHPVGLQVLGR